MSHRVFVEAPALERAEELGRTFCHLRGSGHFDEKKRDICTSRDCSQQDQISLRVVPGERLADGR